jgi:hypothetical protein
MSTIRRPRHLIIACDDPSRGGCGRAIAEVTVEVAGDVAILGPVEAQNGDPGGRLTTQVPDMRIKRRRRGTVVVDVTNPVDRPEPKLRADLLEARLLAHDAGAAFPDGLSYAEGVEAEVAKHQRLLREWDPAGTSSGTGRRHFKCDCRGRRFAIVTQSHLNEVCRRALDAGLRRLRLEDLKRAVR